MSTWALTQGIDGLYGNIDRSQSAKEELGVLQVLDQQIQQKRNQQEQNQLKEQAYYNEISKFADTLLAPDRDKINEKAKLLGMQIRDSIRLYGGSAEKFFANGGHRQLSQYKRDVINSEESSQYLDNKKNMEYIIDIQRQGKGHLLNQFDLANLEAYQKNGGGKITYSGMLNEIDMPDPRAYDYATDIPAADILHNNANYMKIYGNWKLANPNEEREPTEHDLLVFTKKHYNKKGMNTARQLALEKQKLAELKNLQGGKGPKEQFYVGEVSRLLSYMPSNASGFYNRNLYSDFAYKNQLNTLARDSFVDYANDHALDHKAFFDTGHVTGGALGRWFSEEYAPANARVFFQGTEHLVTKSVLNISDDDQIDAVNKVVKNIKPQSNWYDAAGRNLGTIEDELDYETYLGDYDIKGIVNIGVVKTDNNGNPKFNMLMDIYDSDNINEEKTKEYNEGFLKYDKDGNVSKDANIRNEMAIVLQREDGTRFYAPFDPGDPNIATKLNVDLGDQNNIKPVVDDMKTRIAQEGFADQLLAQDELMVDNFWAEVRQRDQSLTPMYSEVKAFSPTGQYDGRRDNLLKSFYGAVATLSTRGKKIPQSEMSNIVQRIFGSTMFTDAIVEATGEQKVNFEEMIKDYTISDLDIILKMLEGDPSEEQKSFYEAWIQNYNYLNK